MSKLNLIKQVLLADEQKLKDIESILEVVNEPREETPVTQLMEEAPLNDGTTMVVADPAFEAGASVMVKSEDGTEIPMPPTGEGEAYELQDGRRFTVAEEGVIAEVMEAGQEEQEEEPVAASDKPTEQPLPKVIIESVVKETKFSKEAEDKIAELEAKVSELSKEPKTETEEVELTVEPITHNPEEVASTGMKFQWSKNRPESAADRVMRKLANK